MPVLGRAHEIVMTKAQLIYKDLPAGSQIIAVILRVQTLFGRCLLDLLSVFIQARQKKRRFSKTLVHPGDGIGHNLFIGMPEMRMPIDIVNGGGEVVFFTHEINATPSENEVRSHSLPTLFKWIGVLMELKRRHDSLMGQPATDKGKKKSVKWPGNHGGEINALPVKSQRLYRP